MKTRQRTAASREAAVDAALSRLWPEAAEYRRPDMEAGSPPSEVERAVAGRVEGIWDDVSLLRGRERYAELLGPPTRRERLVAWWRDCEERLSGFGRTPAFAAAAAMLVLILVASVTIPSFLRTDSYETALAETQVVNLEDGSEVTLGARSALQVDFTARARNVTLTSGEAFFSVTHDPDRPFFVIVDDTTIQVVGTRFNVNRTADGVRVSVLEGVVRITRRTRPNTETGRASVPADEIALQAGQQATAFADPAPVQVTPTGMAPPGSWRTGSLTYEDATLAEIVADANRYSATEIRITSPRGARMRLTTSFRSNQIAQFLETVETALPLDVRREHSGEIVIADRR